MTSPYSPHMMHMVFTIRWRRPQLVVECPALLPAVDSALPAPTESLRALEVGVTRHGALDLDGALFGVSADPDAVAGKQDPSGRALAFSKLGAGLVTSGAVGMVGAYVAHIRARYNCDCTGQKYQ